MINVAGAMQQLSSAPIELPCFREQSSLQAGGTHRSSTVCTCVGCRERRSAEHDSRSLGA